MSNYTPLVLYGPKDSLSNGDPNKVIHGTQQDAELNAIATAIASKQDTPLTNLSIGSTSGTPAVNITASSASGNSFGEVITAGTNSSDYALLVKNSAGSQLLKIQGDGNSFGPAALGSALLTTQSGQFSSTLSGGTTGTVTFTWYRVGPICYLWPATTIGASTGVGGANFRVTCTNLPVTLQLSASIHMFTASVNGNGGSNPMDVFIGNSSTFTFGFFVGPGVNTPYAWNVGNTLVYSIV